MVELDGTYSDGLYFVYEDAEGIKQFVKRKTYLKKHIPFFTAFLSNLLADIMNHRHNKHYNFCIPYQPSDFAGVDHSNVVVPGTFGRLLCIDEICIIKNLRKYIRYLIDDTLKFSIKLHYKGVINLVNIENAYHCYQIELK